MVDLSTQYLGLHLKNPIIAASSEYTSEIKSLIELEKCGAAAVVLKSIFEEEIDNELNHILSKGTHFEQSDEFLDYFDYSLKAENFEKYLKLIKEAKSTLSIPVIASINCTTLGEWTALAKKIETAGADALELNIFLFPSDMTKSGKDIEQSYLDILSKVKSSIKLPVAVKMSPYFTHIPEMTKKLNDAGADGLVLFNRSFSPDFDIEKMRITSSNRFSSPEDYTLPLRWISVCSPRLDCSLAASTGVYSGKTAFKMLLAGSDVIQIASALYAHGIEHIEKIISELEDLMNRKDILNIAQIKGKLNMGKLENPAIFERVQFMRYFAGRK